MIGIYAIVNIVNGKRYIGKSRNVEARWTAHRWQMKQDVRPKDTNRHLFNAVKQYGFENFKFEVLEQFDTVDEVHIAERELYWMDLYDTCNRANGYNLRRDSSSRMIVHEETLRLMSEVFAGEKNPNFGNYWDDDQKSKMSEIAITRHQSGEVYGDDWRRKISERSSIQWQDDEKRNAMGQKVSIAKRKYDYLQFTRDGEFIAKWDSVKDIVAANPGYKWQNIHSVCNGYKPTYMGFVWKKEAKI